MTTTPSPSHVRAAQSRKAAQRTFIRYTAAHIEAEIEGKAPPSKRKRFFISREPLIFIDEPPPLKAKPEPWLTVGVMVIALMFIGFGHAITAGAFKWRPGDQAVSTIDHSLAPHLRPMGMKP